MFNETGRSAAVNAVHASARDSMLLVQTESCICALPLAVVVETMRPLKCTAVANAPGFVLGVSIIRGVATPVVALPALLGESSTAIHSRFVAVRLGSRMAALAVPRVLGVFSVTGHTMQEMPPLLRDANNGIVADVGALDEQLLLVLRAGRIIPDSVWELLREQGQ